MTFAWPIRIIGQVLLAPSAVDVHYRHFAGMIDHPFVICLLPLCLLPSVCDLLPEDDCDLLLFTGFFPLVAFFDATVADPTAGLSFSPPRPLLSSFPPLLLSTPSHLLLPPTTKQLQRRKLRRLWRRDLDVVPDHLHLLPRRDGPDPLYAPSNSPSLHS